MLGRLVQSNLLLFPISLAAERLACRENFVAGFYSLNEAVNEVDRLAWCLWFARGGLMAALLVMEEM